MRIGVTAGVLVRVLAEVLIDGALVVDAVLLEGVKELMAGRGRCEEGGDASADEDARVLFLRRRDDMREGE